MSFNLISIAKKGIILGNPLRFLGCHSGMDIGDIKRAYNDLVRIRLKQTDSILLPIDPFGKYDTIRVNREMADQAIKILDIPGKLLIAKLFYLSDNSIVILKEKNFGADTFSKNLDYLKGFTNFDTQYAVIFDLYVGLFKNHYKNAISYADIYKFISKLVSLIKYRQPKDQNSPYSNQSINGADDQIWDLIIYDLIFCNYYLSQRDLNIAIIIQKAIEDLVSENSKAMLLNQNVGRIYNNDFQAILQNALNDLLVIISDFKNYNTNSYYSNLSKNVGKRVKNAVSPALQLKKLYGNKYIEIKLGLQSVSEKIRDISIDVNNEYEDYASALEILDIALLLAFDSDIKNKLNKDREIINNNYLRKKADNAESPSPVPEYMTVSSKSVPEKKQSPLLKFISEAFYNRPFLAFYTTLFLIAFLIAALSSIFGTNDSQSNRNTKSINNSETQINNNRPNSLAGGNQNYITESELYKTIQNNKQKLREMDGKIDAMNNKLKKWDKEITAIESRLEDYAAIINAGIDSYQKNYDSLYAVYESRINHYNLTIQLGKALLNTYENLIDSTNLLIDIYNERYTK